MCSACQEAKRIFEGDGLDFKYIDLDNMTTEEKTTAAWYEALKEGVVLPYIVDVDAKEFGECVVNNFLVFKMPK